MKEVLCGLIMVALIVALVINLQEVIHWSLTTSQDLGLIGPDVVIPEIKKF